MVPEGASFRAKEAKRAVTTRGGKLYGLPAKRVRDTLREVHRHGWDEAQIAAALGSGLRPNKFRSLLLADKFLDPAGGLTTDGLAVMNAKATKRVTRAKAKESLDALLGRVRYVNDKSAFAYVVKSVTLFGSYLSDSPDVGDVDVMVEYARRFTDKAKQKRAEEERLAVADEEGPVLRDFMARLFWPQREVERYLKAKDRVLSFVEAGIHDEWVKERPHKVVYKAH